ncbi:DUF167 domain-containing protein [Patescibacteria group bacterium]|nr:DUF167 domain-containing protein [Patescibacteria group bacterium]
MPDEILLNIKVRLNAMESKVVEKNPSFWKVDISELPIKGRANRELISLLASEFKVPKSNIAIIRGLKAKEKLVRIIR